MQLCTRRDEAQLNYCIKNLKFGLKNKPTALLSQPPSTSIVDGICSLLKIVGKPRNFNNCACYMIHEGSGDGIIDQGNGNIFEAFYILI